MGAMCAYGDSAMNLRRGFLRAWVVIAIIWVGAVGLLSYSHLAFLIGGEWRKDTPMLPVSCVAPDGSGPRGSEGTDYVRNLETGEPWSAYTCWYGLPRFRALYPEYADLSDSDLTNKLYQKIDPNYSPNSGVIRAVTNLAAQALLPPLGLLIAGIAVAWVAAGFSGRRGAAARRGTTES